MASPGPGASSARWAVVGAGSGPDEFETRASVFISQEEEEARPLLRELLALRSVAGAPQARAAVDLAGQVAALASVEGSGSFARRLHTALQAHGVDRCEEWWEGREWRLLRTPMVECVLNYVLSMCEMLTEERSDFLRKVAVARTWSRVEQRFEDINCPPLREADEEWRLQLNDWQVLLRPYPWNRVRSQVMSHVLSYAKLREPLTQHVRLVRSYEFLRCLGGTLLDGEEKRPQQVAMLQQHGLQYGCWKDSEVGEEALSSYLGNVISASEAPGGADVEGRKEVVAQLGFTPHAVRGSRVPAAVLAHLARRLLAQVSSELREFCESKGLRSTLQTSEALLERVRELLEQQRGPGPERTEPAEPLREFLLAVAADYLERTRSAGPARSVNFALLASGDPRMETLRALEEQAEARRLLDDMALNELQDLLVLIQDAYKMVHGAEQLHPVLEVWSTRLGRPSDGTPGEGLASLHPAEIGELSAALQDFLQQNRRELKVGEEDALLYCVVRALGKVGPSLAGEDAAAGEACALSHYAKPAQSAPRRVVACFGAGEASREARPRSPVVVRSVPLGLGGPGEDYEVRELGIRIGGMYRAVPQGRGTEQSVMGDVAVVHYEWVPPGEVREDSKPLQQILGSATHVRVLLPEGAGTEEREVDLQTNRVSGDSAWYRAIPSRPRTSADEHGGFRRLILEVGRGLRLPLPNGLLQVPPGGGVIETADVLAHVLALWFSQKHARSDMTAALRQRPALLYFASTALFECFDGLAPSFMEALHRHWSSVLGMQGEAAPGQPLTLVQQESQEILLELLTARPDGRLCAVLPSAHLSEFCALAEKTRHSTEFLAVERFCFESALEKISAFQDSTITFIIINITGQISALQLGDLVRHARGAIRLVFNWYHGLIPSLTVTRSLTSVIVPPSIESDMTTQVAPSVYRETFAVGQATLYSSRMMAADPLAITPLLNLQLNPTAGPSRIPGAAFDGRGDLVDWVRNFRNVQQHLREAHAWAQEEERWRCSLPPDAAPQLNQVLLLLVSSDEVLVRRHFEALPESAAVQCFDLHTTDRQALAQVEALLDRTAADRQAAAGPPGGSVGPRTTIVLFGVGFIAPSKLEDIVARAYLGGQRVVLCVQEPIGALRSVRVTTRHATEYVKAKVLAVNTVPALTSTGASGGAAGLRALRLVLGPGAIASERHGALCAALEAEDVSTCIEILQPVLKPEIVADLVAGVMQTLAPGSRAGPADPRALAHAVGCLAASFVLRANALGLDQTLWDVSFPEFRSYAPICRFLDQVSTIEAWCRYLDLVGSDADGGGLSPRLPEGPIRWPRKEPTRHFFLSQWAPASNTHSVGIEDMLEHAVPRESLADPHTEAQAPVMYFGTGPGHHSEAHDEVLERHSLQRRELDWAQFSESWRTALDIKPDVFLQLAAHGVDTLRLFLCLPPERAIELGLTHLLDAAGHGGTPQASLVAKVAQKLLNDVECTGPLLETVVKEGAGEVAARLAAVKWLLLSVLPEKDALAMLSGVGRIDEATVEQLVQAKVMLCPRGREELLRRVVAIVVGLDGGDVLGTQHEIRRYLLETKTLLPELLCDQRAKVGRAIVSFMFSPDHAEQLKRLEVGRAVTEGFERMFGYNVLRWRPPENAEASAEPHRITAAAHAAVLERAPGPEVAHALALGPLLAAVSHLADAEGPKSADAFLSAVLDKLPMSADTLVLAVLETLAGTEPPAGDVMAMLEAPPCQGPLRSALNPFLPELFAALRARSLANYLALVAAHGPGDLGRPLQLALDGSPSLLTMYVEHFRSVTGSAPEEAALHIHNTMLDDASCAALFRHFVAQGESGEERPEDLFLLWYCWGRSPDRQLPFWALPRAQGGSFTKAVNGGPTPFVERCRPIGPGLSVLAKYLIAPECLPLSVYNTMAHQAPWVHSEQGSTIDVVTLLLGQEDCEEYPPYTHRWHARALPSALKERLLRRCHEDVSALRDVKQHHFYPRVSEGVSETTLRFNLGLLMSLTQDNEDLPTYFDHGSDSQRQFVAACIMCWCKSAGLEFEDLKSCVTPSGCERFERLWREFNESYQKEGPMSLRRMYVRGPLPPNMDVRWVEGNQVDVPIFARTRDSALLTAQWLNMLIMHFGLRDMAPFTPEDLVRVSGARGGSLQAGPRLEGALEGVSRAVGSALRRDLAEDERARKLVRPVAAGKYDSMELVVKIAVLTDFVALLRSTPGSVSKCFQGLAAALAAEEGPRPSDAHFGALFDGFFSLQTVDTINEGMEIEELVRAYHMSNLPLSTQSIEEIRWLHENFFGSRNKSTNAVEPKLRAFVSVCERLQRIRSLPLKTVPYQRRNERMVTCADVLREGAVEPPYLKQLHFRLMCERPAGSAPLGAVHSGAANEEVPGGSLEGGHFDAARDEEFFTTTGEEGGAPRGGGGVHRQWDRPEAAEAAWPDLSPVISAPEIVEIDASSSYYLHAVLRVRPGLQPILWRVDRTEGFYRLSGLLGPQRNREGEICKAFATNADAWQYLDRAQSAVVACEGFYLRKADDGTTWVVVFPVSRPPDDQPLSIGELTLRSRRYCIWPLCHSHRLVNLGFNSDTLQVVKLLVWVAWNMVESELDGAGADVLGKASELSAAAPIEIVEPLRQLSVLSNDVERSAAAQVMPEGDEQLVRKMRRLHRYQQYERHLAEVLLRIMTKMKAQQRDDLGGLIRSESQRRSATMRVPFVDSQGQELSNLGRVLQRLLVPIVSKAGIVGSPITTKAWTQLELVLEACYRGEQLPRERCFAKHMHITKVNFAKRGATTLRGIYQSQHEGRRAPTVQLFSDSEDEEERPPRLNERPHEPQGGAEELPRCVQYFEARSDHAYVDTAMDRECSGGTALFDEQVGFGRPVNSRHAVLTFYDEDLPLYFVALNRERLKIQYSASEGMCLGYLVHKNVFAELLEDAKRVAGSASGEDGLQMVRTLRIRLLPWIADVLRSPLPSETKTWILRCCERMGMVAVAPYQEANHVNLALIAYCLCRCCPSGTDAALFLRSVLMNAWHIPADVRTFIERKSDVYGLYVVRPGTLQKMRDLGLHVAVRDFEREVWQRSMNNSAMYLDIISHFSSYCCFCYVQGLPKIDDIVLKWLAEYTRLHPWRFIFLEGVDTSFNFPENRDRCNYRFAPPNPLHTVKSIDDLRSPFVAEIRPSHTIPYPERLQPSAEDIQDPRRLFSFFSREFAPADGEETGQSLFARPPSSSHYSSDFRAELEHHLFSPEPCLVLLVSAPGAGKTHHMGALRGRLEGEMQYDIHEFDGSSDILVTTALAEVLQRTISTQSKSGQKLLILDEYHMLSDEHKDELFEWVRAKLGPTLRVVLIANRSDSKDRQRLEQSRPLAGGPQVRVGLIQTRLSRQRIEQVMGARGNSEKWRDAVCDWLVGSRLVFGEESVSLRLCDTLEQALQRPDPRLTLVELLLHRVPTISRPTATEFVSAYLQHVGLRSQGSGAAAGLVGLCFRIAMLDRQRDELCSFVEFLERTPKAHEALPAVRLLAWCIYMMNARSHWDISLVALWGKRRMFVDQVNFPFELGEESAGGPCSFGPTFSWAGDPTSLRDLVDAVKRGHSVDWADVHRKVWAVEHIKDSELFAQLLSSSRNPAMILQQVMPANLCSLLRLSNTPAPTAVQLARIILRHAPHHCEGTVDRPRCLALWTLVLHDRRLAEPLDVLRLVGGAQALVEALLWARDWATDRRVTVPPGPRTRLLQQLLVLACLQDQLPVGNAQTALLWTGSFGRLLRAATPAQEELWARRLAQAGGGGLSAEFCARGEVPHMLPQAKFRLVIQRVADVQEDWSAEVQTLWRTAHNRTAAREISALWSQAPHLLQDLSESKPGVALTALPVHESNIPGIVGAPGTLCRSLQRALLCNNCQVPEGVSPTAFVTSCADALNEMRNADQLNLVRMGGPNGEAIHRLVKEEMAN